MNAREFGNKTWDELRDIIKMNLQDCEELANLVYLAGDGDHIEIGTAYGGSAILAALTKKHFSSAGKVYCVDPCRLAQEETVYNNARRYEAEIVVVPSESQPWMFAGHKWVSALIDGDHHGDSPVLDWCAVHPDTSGYVMFHDYDDSHPPVVRAGNYARRDPDWKTVVDDPPRLILRRKR